MLLQTSDVLAVFCLQESAKKLEQNVSLFGSTVESLLYRYGKVTFDLLYILAKKQLWVSCPNFSSSFG